MPTFLLSIIKYFLFCFITLNSNILMASLAMIVNYHHKNAYVLYLRSNTRLLFKRFLFVRGFPSKLVNLHGVKDDFCPGFSYQNLSPILKSLKESPMRQLKVGPTIDPGKGRSLTPPLHKSMSSGCLEFKFAGKRVLSLIST